ncbi:MAG: hypothetical protein HY698_11925 [Deltaproteobacteria bacterium]|nr:hypothetical protein [Deltaproteobacteria bacterium]
MSKKQSRRSVSLNRNTYERLRAYCETNDISMSQFVETRIGDFLGRSSARVSKDVDEGRARKEAERIFTF